MKEVKVGVIGLGVVGEVVYKALKKYHKVKGHDKYKKSDRLEDLLDSEVIFVTVPTPEGKDGRLNCSIVEEVLSELERRKYRGIVAIKSTVKVGFFDSLRTNLRVVYNPEFLHEKRRWEDFKNPPYLVFAGRKKDCEKVREVYKWISEEKVEYLSFREAELVKLLMNAFASTKISFWNEVREICEERKVDTLKIRNLLKRDKRRWTDEYTNPLRGPYGGKCLPKDIRELINWKRDLILLRAVEEVNKRVKEKWEV